MSDGIMFKYADVPYEFDPTKLTVLEAIELKKVTGLTFMDWIGGLEKFEPESIRFMVWLSLSRAGARPEVRYSEFDFDMLEVVNTMVDPDAEPAVDVEPDPTTLAEPTQTTSA